MKNKKLLIQSLILFIAIIFCLYPFCMDFSKFTGSLMILLFFFSPILLFISLPTLAIYYLRIRKNKDLGIINKVFISPIWFIFICSIGLFLYFLIEDAIFWGYFSIEPLISSLPVLAIGLLMLAILMINYSFSFKKLKEKFNKNKRLIFAIIIFSALLYFILRFVNNPVLKGIVVAYIIGILAIFQNEIRNWIFRPILIPNIKISKTITTNSTSTKYYNLNIRNNGFVPAKNIRVKIKSEEDKEWLSLLRPFWAISKSIFINKLSPQEEENFNIGNIYENQTTFQIITDVRANNQKLILNSGEKHQYLLEIVSDNTKPISLKINVDNKGFDSNNIILLNN